MRASPEPTKRIKKDSLDLKEDQDWSDFSWE